ncbi:MAG: PfkB family carbohydrate kinase [Nitrospinota bacterium]|nr:PfkB family carbohydrate kinase [Nitrospinota bacterium]
MRLNKPLGQVLVYGEVLFDKFPDRTSLGGAPFNYAFHLNHLGVPVRLISRVGGDQQGQDIMKRLQSIGFSIEGVQLDIIHPTGEVEVNLDDKGVPEFNILPDRAYDYIEFDSYIEALARKEIALVYFGTLAQRHSTSAETLYKILKLLSSRSTFMMDINLRYPFYTPDVIEKSLQNCDILKVNQDELSVIKESLSFSSPVSRLPWYLLDRYKIGFLCVTKGEEGTELYEAGSKVSFHCPGLPQEEVVDTVGAGDAFCAMLTAGYLAGWPKQTLIEKATEFSHQICEFSGALPENLEFYKPFRFNS